MGVPMKVFGPKGQGFIQGWVKFHKEQLREFYISYYSGLPMEEEEMGEDFDTFRGRRKMRKGFW
jgi:hypothetical protein